MKNTDESMKEKFKMFLPGGYSLNDKIYDRLLKEFDIVHLCTLVNGKALSYEEYKTHVAKVIEDSPNCIGCAFQNTNGFTFDKNRNVEDIRQILGNVCREKGKRVFIFNKKLPVICNIDLKSSFIGGDISEKEMGIIFYNFDYHNPENMDFEFTFKGDEVNLFFNIGFEYSLFCEHNLKHGKLDYKISEALCYSSNEMYQHYRSRLALLTK